MRTPQEEREFLTRTIRKHRAIVFRCTPGGPAQHAHMLIVDESSQRLAALDNK